MQKCYYVIEENTSSDPKHEGMRYIHYKGCVFQYGDFSAANGYSDFSGALKAWQKLQKQYPAKLAQGSVNRCSYYIEKHFPLTRGH